MEILFPSNHLTPRFFLIVLEESKVSFDSFQILVLQVIHFPRPSIELLEEVLVKREFLQIDIEDLVKLEQD